MKNKQKCSDVRQISIKRCFIEYFLISLAIVFVTAGSRLFGLTIFLMINVVVLLFLRLYVFQTVKGIYREDFVFGKKPITYVALSLFIVEGIKQYVIIGSAIFKIDAVEDIFITTLPMQITFLNQFLIALCHENLYRIRLFDAVTSKYMYGAKKTIAVVVLLLTEGSLAFFDGAIWSSSWLGFVLLFVFFISRVFFCNKNVVINAMLLAFTQCAYALVVDLLPVLSVGH